MASKMIEMFVTGVVIDTNTNIPAVILENHNHMYKLPISIGQSESQAIARALVDKDMDRPMTHDLLMNIMDLLGGEVESVEITSYCDSIFIARVEVIQDLEEPWYVDSRPSDAIVLALKTNSPIYVAQEVLNETCAPILILGDKKLPLKVVNITPVTLKLFKDNIEPDEEFNNFIKDVKPSDFKLKDK